MKIFIKGLNTCTQRNQKLRQYRAFLLGNKHEIVSSPEQSDAILLWTCAFRGDVRDNSLVQIDGYSGQYDGEVIVAGCLPDISPTILHENFKGEIIPWKDDYELMEKKFRIEGGPSLHDVEEILIKPPLCEDAAMYRAEHPEADVTFHDQYIQLVISEGCPFKCTYCSERLAFPEFRSFSQERLIECCRVMIKETGRYEIVLISDCLGEYGRDTHSSICELIDGILAIDPRVKLALNNYHPSNFLTHFDRMIEFVRSGRIHHVNLPVQSGSDRILKLMNRTYTRADIEKIYSTFREIGFKDFDTHCLIGFPGESDEDFEATMSLILDYRPKYVLLSRFLECEDAPAAQLGDKVSPEKALERAIEGERRITAAGIICNSDAGEVMKNRFKRLNRSCTESCAF